MAFQSPMISIPKKGTDEVDWTTPIKSAIMHSYGEDPENYTSEYASLQRCRQDAVRGAGSDFTARDLLYKYFGQLELLELRFPEIRVNFPWKDAFTTKTIVQTSLAYEKASIIFNIAATHSAIAASQSRSDPEGIKRAFYYFRCSAGMLTYINENFLHAPSTDLSRDVIKFLVGIILAQATEVFFEKCRDEKKGHALMSKIASQASYMYTGLSEEVKEFMGKGIFDRNWVTIIQAKAKCFTALMQYYRGQADHAAGKYGDALVRFQLAETHAKEAHKIASGFGSMFLPQMSPNLPPDAGQSIADLTKAHLALCSDRRAEAQKDNDLIYNAVLPTAETLAAVDKTAVATPIPIQEIYGTADVQRVIGPDLFQRLIPLSVHESASVYSEEKAKLVRAEVERSESAEVEARSAVDALGVKTGLPRFRAMVEGGVAGEDEVPIDVRRWREDISLIEQREGIDLLLERLAKIREGVRADLDGISRELETESRDCEAARVKYDHLFSQEPSSGLTRGLRTDLKSHLEALDAAAASDGQVHALWDVVSRDINVLISDDIEQLFRDTAVHGHNRRESLLDLDMEKDDTEKAKIGEFVDQIEERLSRLAKIERERIQTLKDLKDKIQNDDVSHLLLLNRRNPNVEPTIFASELEKFRPYQQRLTQAIHQQAVILQEITQLWKSLKDLAGRGEGARKWEERERRKKETVRRFSNARDGYMEARDGLAKGLQFYSELSSLVDTLRDNARAFVSSRTKERLDMVGKAEAKQRLSATPSAPPPRPPPPPSSTLERSFAAMGLDNYPSSPPATSAWPPPPPANPSPVTYGNPSQQYQNPQLPLPSHVSSPLSRPMQSSLPPAQQRPAYGTPSHPSQPSYGGPLAPSAPSASSPYALGQPSQLPYPSPGSPPVRDPYASLGTMSFASPTPPPPPSQGHYHQQQPQHQGSYPPPPPQPVRQPSYPPPSSSQQQYQYPTPAPQGPATTSPFPPPPPPVSYQHQPQYGTHEVPPPASQYAYPAPPSQNARYQPPPPPPQQQTQYNAYGQYSR